jgi:hypothetical protein
MSSLKPEWAFADMGFKRAFLLLGIFPKIRRPNILL